MTDPEIRLKHGDLFPYDAPDDWWEQPNVPPPPAEDRAHAAARGILADLMDRRGIRAVLEGLDEEVRRDIVTSLAAIIRRAWTEGI